MFEKLYDYYNTLANAILTTLKIKKKITKIEKRLKKKLKDCHVEEVGKFENEIGLHLSQEEYREVDKETIKN